MQKTLVTGANGLLATNIIVALLEKGYQVRGLLRDFKKYKGPEHKNLELVTGDITDHTRMQEVLSDCNSIIHVAALTSHGINDYTPYKKVNVEATESLVQLSLEKGFKKFIYVSSANAFGFGTLENPGTEKSSIRPPFSSSFYALSKLKAQEKVLSYQKKIPVCVVNPTFLIGPYDGKPSSGQIILMGYKKRVIFCPPGGKNFVNAMDAAEGVVDALEKGKNGQAYLLAGNNLSFRNFFKKLNQINKQRSLIITIPAFLLNTGGYFGNFLRFLGINTQLSVTNIKILCVNNFYSSEKAKKELKTNFRDIETGIREAIEWFRKNGKIDA